MPNTQKSQLPHQRIAQSKRFGRSQSRVATSDVMTRKVGQGRDVDFAFEAHYSMKSRNDHSLEKLALEQAFWKGKGVGWQTVAEASDGRLQLNR